MIKIEKNENITGFFGIFAFGKLIEEVQGRGRAVSLAKKIAREHKKKHFISHNNKIQEVEV
jgi:hypothetical protein